MGGQRHTPRETESFSTKPLRFVLLFSASLILYAKVHTKNDSRGQEKETDYDFRRREEETLGEDRKPEARADGNFGLWWTAETTQKKDDKMIEVRGRVKVRLGRPKCPGVATS